MDINAIADQYSENLFKFSPELGTFYRITDADHINLTDICPTSFEHTIDAQDKLYKKLMTVDVNQLNKNDNITYHYLKTKIEGEINREFVIVTFGKIVIWVPFILSIGTLGKISL